MKIGLVSYRSKNKNIAFNLRQIERALKESQGKAELLCFGEAFLQGFDALTWDYASDYETAVERGSDTIDTLCKWTQTYGVGLLTGYFEREGDSVYSSCVVIDGGRILHNYRRISEGWKEPDADAHYREGDRTGEFRFHGRLFMPALCGDLWDFPERFKTDHLLIWPVYLSFSREQWEQEELRAYAEHTAHVANDALVINSIDPDNGSIGGAFRMHRGRITEQLPFGREGILYTQL